jgi:hypothetical protein
MKPKIIDNVPGVPPGPQTNAIGGRPIAGMIFSSHPPEKVQRQIWDNAIAEAKREVPEIKDDREAVRRALKEARMKRTTRVRGHLP